MFIMAKWVIYILTNPSFPDYVKIWYADNLEERLNQLNRSECIPFAFRVYAYYEVAERLTDIKLHAMIDKLNPTLRAIDDFNGKKRVREFYAMDAEDAYSILETIAEVNWLKDKLIRVTPTKQEQEAEKKAIEISNLNINRHHFKEIHFISSGIEYLGKTNEQGTLCIINLETWKEIENNSTPSKAEIIRKGIEYLWWTIDKGKSPYSNYHILTKMVLWNNNVGEFSWNIIKKAKPFSFYDCWIKNWEEISYLKDEKVKAKVVGDKKVEYSWETMTLTGLARKLLWKKSSEWVAWPDYFSYKWKKINDIRREKWLINF